MCSSLVYSQDISVETSESKHVTLLGLQNNHGEDRLMCVHFCSMSKLIQQPLFLTGHWSLFGRQKEPYIDLKVFAIFSVHICFLQIIFSTMTNLKIFFVHCEARSIWLCARPNSIVQFLPSVVKITQSLHLLFLVLSES